MVLPGTSVGILVAIIGSSRSSKAHCSKGQDQYYITQGNELHKLNT